MARGAAVVAAGLPALGLRLVDPLTGPEGCRTIARAVSATTTGFAVAALADPDLVTTTTRLAPFGTTRSVPAGPRGDRPRAAGPRRRGRRAADAEP